MTALEAHGIRAELPAGFEGRIFVRPAVAEEQTYPVAHFATFPLPAEVGDFGAGAVTLMGPGDVFVVLFDYGPSSLGTRLFARQGMPRSLGPGDFRPTVLRRGLGGQSGTQWFFTEAGRPFTLYAVLGSHRSRAQLVPRVNELLGSLVLAPTAGVPAPAAAGTAPPTGWN
ncbi:MAG TPA: hypothetical protein VKW77_01935 [Acidimicrobiales bacterium]|nr:hypothetical protein [Acidimicrobiales bacterium]